MTLSEWKSLPITQAIMRELTNRVANLKDELGKSAGIDPVEDRRKSGVICAWEDVLNIDMVEETHGN